MLRIPVFFGSDQRLRREGSHMIPALFPEFHLAQQLSVLDLVSEVQGAG